MLQLNSAQQVAARLTIKEAKTLLVASMGAIPFSGRNFSLLKSQRV
jgi:hypothetical protein